jgi:hypothetical protein
VLSSKFTSGFGSVRRSNPIFGRVRKRSFNTFSAYLLVLEELEWLIGEGREFVERVGRGSSSVGSTKEKRGCSERLHSES